MASSAPSASAERTPLGKKLNSQTKYLLMKLWEYFKQEAKKCKICINITERISKATGIVCNSAFFAGFLHTLRHAGISRTSIRMEHRKKGGLFTPRKRYKMQFAQARSIVIVRYINVHESMLMQTVLTQILSDKIHSLYGRKEIYRSQRFW